MCSVHFPSSDLSFFCYVTTFLYFYLIYINRLNNLQPVVFSILVVYKMDKISHYHLISWCGNHPKPCGYFAFPQTFPTRKLVELSVFCAVYLLVYGQRENVEFISFCEKVLYGKLFEIFGENLQENIAMESFFEKPVGSSIFMECPG